MFESLERGLGLEIVVALQSAGSPALDTLALALYLVGGFVFYLLAGTFCYWSVDKGLGKRLLIVLLVTGVLVAALKLGFQRPRPYTAFPDQVSHVIEEGTYGIPSGHVAFALAWWGYLAWRIRTRRAWLLVIGYTALMGWGRMYIGAHYPQDVVAGIVVALVALAICTRFPSGVVEAWNALPFSIRALLVVLTSSVIAVFLHDDSFMLVVAGVLPGAAFGAYIEGRAVQFSTMGSRMQRLTRFILGVVLLAGVFVLLWLMPVLSTLGWLRLVLIYAILGVGITAGFPWLGLRLGFFNPSISLDSAAEH